jgi:hypothetical protein
MLGWHLVLVTLYRSLDLVLSKTIRIGDTKYFISCSQLSNRWGLAILNSVNGEYMSFMLHEWDSNVLVGFLCMPYQW